jgi:hypothetical protein
VALLLRGPNLATSAVRVLTPIERPAIATLRKTSPDTPNTFFTDSPESLRDGRRRGEGATFASIGAGSEPRTDTYGYEWARPQTIGMLALTTGFMDETTGWFETLTVQYRDESGEWRSVNGLDIQPPFPAGEPPSFQAHFAEFLMSFQPVETRAIRIIGPVGKASKDGPRFTSVAELAVYVANPAKR